MWTVAWLGPFLLHLTIADNLQQVGKPMDGSDLNLGLQVDSFPETSVEGGHDYFYNITDSSNKVLAYLNLTKGPLTIDLVKIGKDKKAVVLATSQLRSIPTITASKQTLESKQELITAQFKFTEKSTSKSFELESAELDMSIQVGGPSRVDYWNMTSASLKFKFNYNNTGTKDLTVDLTPKPGYTRRAGDTNCELGYGICAPLNLCWTCTDQILKQVDTSSLSADDFTAFLHFPGMRLQPKVGEKPLKWGYNWDCEPLIPLSVWIGVLITIGLAAVVMWGLLMVGSIYTPDKYDDPKGPSIHVPQAD